MSLLDEMKRFPSQICDNTYVILLFGSSRPKEDLISSGYLSICWYFHLMGCTSESLRWLELEHMFCFPKYWTKRLDWRSDSLIVVIYWFVNWTLESTNVLIYSVIISRAKLKHGWLKSFKYNTASFLIS